MTRLADRFQTALIILLGSSLGHVGLLAPRSPKGVLLENLTWVEAKDRLTRDAVVVIPLGAEAKEHGPHLRLANDWILTSLWSSRSLGAR